MRRYLKWLIPGIRIKRWIALLILGNLGLSTAVALGISQISAGLSGFLADQNSLVIELFALAVSSLGLIIIALIQVSRTLIAPYRSAARGNVVDLVFQHQQRHKGMRFVAIGGGTGLPAALRGMKAYTSNITAIVTVADDGGSSGRLRRDLGVLPPGDLRNNIAALADDESLLTHLFQYRFEAGDLQGHAFGNLFIAALANVVAERNQSDDRNNLAEALVEVGRVLNIQGRVLPATLEDIHLAAKVRLNGSDRLIYIQGESNIGHSGGIIENIAIEPADVEAYPESVRAILEADLIAIGPGSLYTSILPNLMVKGIADALRATSAYKVYICNVATQPSETEGYTLAEHVLALEKHIGRGVFQAVLANNAYPQENAGVNTRYVAPAAPHHEILQRYELRYTDLTDVERPWRHDPQKLASAILTLSQQRRDNAFKQFRNVS